MNKMAVKVIIFYSAASYFTTMRSACVKAIVLACGLEELTNHVLCLIVVCYESCDILWP